MSSGTRFERRRIVTVVAIAATVLAAGVVTATSASSATYPAGDASIRLNQVGFAPALPKRATVVNTSTTPLSWQLRNAAGTAVASGTTTVKGNDGASGEYVHTVDFSSFTGTGEGFRLEVAGRSSHAFTIANDVYNQLAKDSLAFFYHQRSGIAIQAGLVGSAYARPAGHLGISPNRGDTDVPCQPGVCDYRLDARGGWYDAGDQGKYVVNGGISVWQLLDAYERSRNVSSANRNAFADGSQAIPEAGNGVSDILDEARWEIEFLLRMQVPDGRPRAGMAFHKLHDQNWTGIPQRPETDSQPRELHPPSTAATLNLAAVAAQCARVWKTIDSAFASKCQTAAEKAWTAARANPAVYASGSDSTGGGAYGDNDVSDEFYWAAAELYVTTGSSTYSSFLGSSPHNAGASVGKNFGWPTTAALGDITLAIVPNGLSSSTGATIRQRIVTQADALLNIINTQGYGVPLGSAEYWWGSSGEVNNRATLLALAADFTGQSKYRDGALSALDYLLGRNALGNSYVTGFGTVYSKNQHHRFWAHQYDASLPNPPAGSLAGGPDSALEDDVARQRLGGCAPQKCYVDDIGSYSTNEVAINWNSGLVWLTSYAAEKATGTTPLTSAPPTSTVPTSRPPTSAPPTSTVPTSRPPTSAPPTSTVPTSRPPTSAPPTSPPPAGGCSATYKVTGQWSGGFQGEVTVQNTGTTATASWTVSWTFPNGQTITQLWGGISSVSGTTQTVKNEAWNGVLAPNATTTFGFLGTWTTANGVPATVTCTRT